MLLVDHVVPGLQLQRVDAAAPRLGIRRMSRVVGSPPGCPARSLSVIKASLTAGQTKPFSTQAVVTYGTPGSGASSRSLGMSD